MFLTPIMNRPPQFSRNNANKAGIHSGRIGAGKFNGVLATRSRSRKSGHRHSQAPAPAPAPEERSDSELEEIFGRDLEIEDLD